MCALSEHCSCGDLQPISKNRELKPSPTHTQMEVVVLDVADQHQAANDVNNGCPKRLAIFNPI